MQSLSVPFVFAYGGITEYLLRHPDIAPFYDRASLEVVRVAIAVVGAVFVGLALLTYLLRERNPAWLVPVTLYVYSVTNGVVSVVLGSFTSPYPLVLVGAGAIGTVLFPRPVAFTALALGIGTVGVGEALALGGVFPYAPVLRGAPFDGATVSTFWAVQNAVLVGSVGALILLIFSFVIARLHDRERKLDALVRTDPLTGIANRRELIDALEREHARAARQRSSLALVLVDLDHFKSVNDRFGHPAGDFVLQQAASRLVSAVRSTDLVARFGGEEFAILMPDTDGGGAARVAERCRKALAEAPITLPSGTPLVVTGSFGVATLRTADGEGTDSLLSRADEALYDAKTAGRDRVSAANIPGLESASSS